MSELKLKLEQAEARVETEIAAHDARFEKKNREILSDIALSLGELWCCQTPEDARKIVARFAAIEFSDVLKD